MFTPISLPGELWKEVPEAAGRYYVSTLGRLLTIAWKGTSQARVMKPALDPCGYMRTMIVRDGRTRTIKIHRLVAQTFLPNPANLSDVNHINGIKSDNRPENLEWMSRKQNMQHAFRTGLQHIRGVSNPACILTEAQVLEIRSKHQPRIYTREVLATEYGVSLPTIKDILRGATWKHLL